MHTLEDTTGIEAKHTWSGLCFFDDKCDQQHYMQGMGEC